MKRILLSMMLLICSAASYGQMELNDSIIEHIVKNERQYFNEITAIYKSDDPMLHVSDIALVYYGQAFLPQYNPGKDENEKLLKRLYEEKRNAEMYNVAKNILNGLLLSCSLCLSLFLFLFSLLLCCFLFKLLLAKLVVDSHKHADNAENAECNYKEVNDKLNEVTVFN